MSQRDHLRYDLCSAMLSQAVAAGISTRLTAKFRLDGVAEDHQKSFSFIYGTGTRSVEKKRSVEM
jgi:hypothetical protein